MSSGGSKTALVAAITANTIVMFAKFGGAGAGEGNAVARVRRDKGAA